MNSLHSCCCVSHSEISRVFLFFVFWEMLLIKHLYHTGLMWLIQLHCAFFNWIDLFSGLRNSFNDIWDHLLTHDRFKPIYTRWPKMIKYFPVLFKSLNRLLLGWAPEIMNLLPWLNPPCLGQWLQARFQITASIIIIEFATIILFWCILFGLQCPYPDSQFISYSRS